MKKLTLAILAVILAATVIFTACGNKTPDTDTTAADTTVADDATTADDATADGETVGAKFQAAFEAAEATDAAAIAEELCKVDEDLGLVTMEMQEGYLDGFDADITGFTKCVKFSPMIGAIPFVGYVFETEDAEGLLETLKANANPAWNICTEADETVSATADGLVFFLMCSNETAE